MKKGLSYLCAFALMFSMVATVPSGDDLTGCASSTTREHMIGS